MYRILFISCHHPYVTPNASFSNECNETKCLTNGQHSYNLNPLQTAFQQFTFVAVLNTHQLYQALYLLEE